MKKPKEPTITTNRIKLEEDIISSLPDCLIIEILSRLPDTKYAIRTGTLSKRWQHLWTFVYNLIFNNPYKDSLDDDFFPFVDKTLTQCRQFNINKFQVQLHHSYYGQFESQVRNWIHYAITCNVKDLVLDLTGEIVEPEFLLEDESFIFNNSSFTHLTLGGCIFYPTGHISWKTLKTLCVSNGYLDDGSIQNILSGSPLLETLTLSDCYGYSRLDITSKSVKNLVFSGYMDPYPTDFTKTADIIEINAPYISSLTIRDDLWLWKLLLLNVSSLVNAEVDYTMRGATSKEAEGEMLKGFILGLSHVKELKIGMSCLKAFFHLGAVGFKFPSNLKVLIHFR